MKKFLLILVVSLAIYGFVQLVPKFLPVGRFFTSELSTSDKALENAFKNQQGNIQVGDSGEVIKILPDDTQGNRHQKFIIELNSEQTLLIAHNIDVAPG